MSINHVTVSGNLAREIELKFTATGTAIADFTIAVNERFKQGDEWQERTHWIGVVAWAGLAERIAKRFAKGDAILVTGSLMQESWEDKESGKKREKTKVTARECEKIEKMPRREDGGQSTARQPAGATTGKPKDPDLDVEDDIPFN